MKVKMFYDNGHFDIFDTDSHVEKVFKRNVVTDYSFDLREHNGQELWLTIYYYEAADEFLNDIGPTGVPVSHRRDGWTVLLADAGDMGHLRRVSVDGETVLIRILDELVDAQTLEYASDIADYYTPRISKFYDYYLKAVGREMGGGIDEEVCTTLAVSPSVVRELMLHLEANRSKENGDIRGHLEHY